MQEVKQFEKIKNQFDETQQANKLKSYFLGTKWWTKQCELKIIHSIYKLN